jgi:ATP-dependent DNA helicase PIF1
VFECGQTYVALSRVKSLEGLYLTAFNYQKVYTNKKVKEYYKENVYFEKKAVDHVGAGM